MAGTVVSLLSMSFMHCILLAEQKPARLAKSADTELDKSETHFADAAILFRYAKYKGYRMADETD